MLHAWCTTTSWLTDLFTAPRLTEPVWLTLNANNIIGNNSNCTANNSNNMAQNFMNELCWLLTHADTKDTNL